MFDQRLVSALILGLDFRPARNTLASFRFRRDYDVAGAEERLSVSFNSRTERLSSETRRADVRT